MPREQFNRKISPLIEDRLPDFVRGQFTTFQSFVEHYYKWMEQEGNPVERTGTLLQQRDVDEADDEFLGYLQNEYLQSFPESFTANKRLVLKNIDAYQKAKGTPQAFKFLFRVLYAIDVDIMIPWNQVIAVSDTPYQIDTVIKLSTSGFGSVWKSAVNGRATQTNTGATAVIDKVRVRYENGVEVAELYLHEIVGDFDTTNKVTASWSVAGTTKIAFGYPLFNVVSGLTIVGGGEGYQTGENLVFAGVCAGTGARAYVSSVDSNGAITGVELVELGINYETSPAVTVSSTGGTGADITATVNATGTYPGYYINSRGGFLSDGYVLQDSEYWQKFSYVIESDLDDGVFVKDYKAAVKGAAHPAGMKMFGRVLIEETQDASQESDTIMTAITTEMVAGISSSSSS